MQKRPTVIWQLNANNERTLSTYEAYRTIDEIATLQPSRFVIKSTGRADLDQLIEYALRRKLEPALELADMGKKEIDSLQRFGLRRVIFNVDRPDIDRATAETIRHARDRRLAVEINTLVTKENMAALAKIVSRIEPFDIAAWNVDFGVHPTLTAADAEQVFAFIAAVTSARKFNVRACEAPQYARYLLQGWSDFAGYVPAAGENNPTMFISESGDVRAAECLPFSAGNVRYRPLKTILRTSDLFAALADARNLHGKCGRCDYRKVCGGSRPRAWCVTGDLFAPDPLCAYQPA